MKPTKITRELLAGLTFRPFTKQDWYGFQGCESPVPFIAEEEDFLVILDGDYAELYVHDYEFGAVDTCDSIRELSHKTQLEMELEESISKMKKELSQMEEMLSLARG